MTSNRLTSLKWRWLQISDATGVPDLIRVLNRRLKTLADSLGEVPGAPVDAEYIVGSANDTLTAERVVTDTATVTWDLTVPGQAKANATAAVTGTPWRVTISRGALNNAATGNVASVNFVDTILLHLGVTATRLSYHPSSNYVLPIGYNATSGNWVDLVPTHTDVNAFTVQMKVLFQFISFRVVNNSGGILDAFHFTFLSFGEDNPTCAVLADPPDGVASTGTWAPSLIPVASLSGYSAAPVSSVFGRTGAVVKAGGDYAVADVTGAAPLASPTFTGTPLAPTAAASTNNTQIATTAYVDAAVITGNPFTPGAILGYAYSNAASGPSADTAADTAIPGMSVSFTLTTTTVVKIDWCIRAAKLNGYMITSLYDGGVVLAPLLNMAGVAPPPLGWYLTAMNSFERSNQQGAFTYIVSLASGAHTIQVYHSASANLNNVTFGERSLVVTTLA